MIMHGLEEVETFLSSSEVIPVCRNSEVDSATTSIERGSDFQDDGFHAKCRAPSLLNEQLHTHCAIEDVAL
jgi:hypothetical protein